MLIQNPFIGGWDENWENNGMFFVKEGFGEKRENWAIFVFVCQWNVHCIDSHRDSLLVLGIIVVNFLCNFRSRVLRCVFKIPI